MKSRLLFKTPVPGHDYNIYECQMCDRHHQRKIKGQRKMFKVRKIRRIMEKSLA